MNSQEKEDDIWEPTLTQKEWDQAMEAIREANAEREWHEREDESIPPWMDEEEITALEYEDDEEEEEEKA